jgi:protein-tyrosine phosphatase
MISSILFVCTGNICRSPTADGIMRALAPHLTVDSAGTHSYHIGAPPDPRSVKAAKERGYDISSLRARKVKASDFHEYDLIVAMDEGHYELLAAMQPKGATARLVLFCEHAGLGVRGVPDPYYGGPRHFEECLDLIEQGCKALLK